MTETIGIDPAIGVRSRMAARHDLPLIAGTISIVAWGVGPLFVKAVSVSAATMVLYRLWIGVALMTAMARFTGGRVGRDSLRRTAGLGVIFGIAMVFGFASFKATSIANATIIGALAPALVLVIAAKAFGEHQTRHQLIGAAAGFVGVIVVVLGANSAGDASLVGDAYAVVNLILWVFYLFAAKRVRADGMHAGTFIASIFLWAAVVVTPWALVTSDDLGSATGRDMMMIVGMAAIPGLVGHSLMAWAQRDLDVSIVSLLGLGNPVLGALGAWIVYEQTLTAWQLVGATLVMIGLVGVVLDQRSILEAEAV